MFDNKIFNMLHFQMCGGYVSHSREMHRFTKYFYYKYKNHSLTKHNTGKNKHL